MNFQEFETILMPVLIGALVLFMIFIIYDLARQSNSGKFDSFVLSTSAYEIEYSDQ